MSSQIVLILGAGANVGRSLAQKFAGKGFKVAAASRSINPELAKAVDASTKVDFSIPSSIKDVFIWAKSEIGIPSVVVYNAAANTMGPPFSVSPSQFETDLAVNTSSVYVAIQEALAGFESLPSGTPKIFIFTGNRLNVEPMPVLLSMGVGKTGAAHLIQAASMAFKDKGYGFYYADERKVDGSPVGTAISGEAAAEFYYELSQKQEQGPWDATFVSGTGYVHFAE